MKIRGRSWMLGLLWLTGCTPFAFRAEEPPTQQVSSPAFVEPQKAAPLIRVNYAPAAQETAYRVELMRSKLIGDNPQTGLQPYVTAIAAADPEIFHVGLNQVYITEPLVRQCQSEGQLAAVLAYELGRMVSQREATVSEQIRQPDRPLPIQVPIGNNGNPSEANPLNYVEMARFEKQYPRKTSKLIPPNPQQVARNILEHSGYQRTELDAALPLLQNAERYSALENQLKGTLKQSDWKAP